MKKLLYSSLAIAAMAVSCQEAELENNGAANNGEVFRISAALPETKTTLNPDDYTVAWESSDELTVIVNSNTAYKFTNAGGDNFEAAGVELEPTNVFHALYPYNDKISGFENGKTNTFVPIPVEYNIAQVQSKAGDVSHIKGTMWGIDDAAISETPKISMMQLTSLFKIIVNNPGDSPINIQSISFSTDVDDAILCGTFYIYEDGTLESSGPGYVSNSTTLTVTDGTIAANGAAEFWLATTPFTVPEGNKVIVTLLADEGEVTVERTAPAEGWNFEEGKVNIMEDVVFEGAETVDYLTVTEALSATGKVNVEGVVMAKNARSYILADETSYVLAYKNALPDEVNVGDRVRISGEMSEFNGMAQITSPMLVSTVSSSDVTYPDPVVLDADAADALVASPEQKYIQFTGMLNISGSYYNVTIDGASSVGSISYPADDLSEYDGKAVTITGYFNGVSGGRYLNIFYTEIEEAPYCTVSPATLSVDAEAGTATFNISSNESWTISTSNENYKLSETSGEGNAEITVTYPANETDEAITVTFTVKSESGEKTVTLTHRSASQIVNEKTETLSFVNWEFDGADSWTSSYEAHNVDFTIATVEFSSANKQNTGNTIDDCPVTKGQPVVLKMKGDATLSEVTVNLKQWASKSQTASIYTSTDGGATFSSEAVASSNNFVVSVSGLPVGVNAIQVKFSSSSNQVGIQSFDITYTE